MSAYTRTVKRNIIKTICIVKTAWHKPLLRLFFFLFLGYCTFSLVPSSMDHNVNPALLMYIAVVYTFGVSIMVVYTRRWNTIGQGLLCTMLGDALLYGRISTAEFDRHFFTSEFVTNVIRASFLVGATFLLWGIIQWMYEDARSQGPSITDTLTDRE